MWYQTWPRSLESSVKPGAVLNYATSEDGIHWQRPALGLVEWDGSRVNNIVLREYEYPTVVERPDDLDPDRRYWLMCLTPDRKEWVVFVSPDGIRWTGPSGAGPKRGFGILTRDTANLFYDEVGQQWVSPCKLCRRVGQWPDWSIRRCLGISTSADGETWEVPELVLAPDARDDAMAVRRMERVLDRLTTNHPDEYWCDFQNMQVLPYEGIYIGLITVFDASGMGPAGNQDGLVRVQLAVSRDLRHWTRVADRRTFIDLGPLRAFDSHMIIGPCTPVVLPDQIRIYYGGFCVSHMDGRKWQRKPLPAVQGGIGLATIRRDGFVALEVGQVGSGRVTADPSGRTSAGAGEGYFRTKHFTFTGRELCLNVDSAAYGRANGVMRVEFVEPDDTPIAGFSREECDPIKVDSLRHSVTWGGSADVSRLQGKIVRLKFYCRTTRLYSFWFE
jgi:hypothetical protein